VGAAALKGLHWLHLDDTIWPNSMKRQGAVIMEDVYMSRNVRSVAMSGIRQYTALAKATPGCVPLTIGEPDFNTPDVIRQAAKKALDDNLTHYPPNNGEAFLREAIADFEKKRSGYDYSPDEVMVTVGATGAVFSALMGIINPGDEVIVPVPAFALYENIIKLCGGVYVPMDTSKDGFQITPEAFDGTATPRTKAIVLNSPNNPTGCILNEKSLEAVYGFVKTRPVFVLCDDVYSRLAYDGEVKSFASYRDLREKILYIQSFSKPYAMTGWRVGYLCADRGILATLQKVHQNSAVSVVSFVQKACEAALNVDISNMLQSYRSRRDYVFERLAAMGFDVYKPGGAFYIFPSVKKFGMDSDTFARRLITEGGVGTVPASCFGCEGFVRISYCYGKGELETALDRVEAFISKL